MARETRKRKLAIYEDDKGKQPYVEWLASLRDATTRTRIIRRVDRIENGNFGDHKSVSDGVSELRLFFGSGYRVYYAEDGDTVVLLLCGGDKGSQDADIERAKSYWLDYQERTR